MKSDFRRARGWTPLQQERVSNIFSAWGVALAHVTNGDIASAETCFRAAAEHVRDILATRVNGSGRKGHAGSENFFYRHGKYGTSEYSTWRTMIQRCHNPNGNGFATYGASGVSVCDRWRQSFENFFSDVGAKPSPIHSLDRYPNRLGNYEPGNVRWATPKQQSENRHNTRWLTFDGQTLSLADWARKSGLSTHALRGRIDRGWETARALSEPMQERAGRSCR